MVINKAGEQSLTALAISTLGVLYSKIVYVCVYIYICIYMQRFCKSSEKFLYDYTILAMIKVVIEGVWTKLLHLLTEHVISDLQ